ncbi:hypothetical protein K470DRAFT_259589 [Piedraia hortae CBS 480.64]|uniref:Telomere-associated protein Rif1 N-terminal domain-containing protein n=1 Tax=Piedraia hortae CBS 480.64 TaxID=1314780 RepID=A0A6A7BU15_9PEZI|nr:hypothetical protein K470DRAFT_259589 [Piedraia hortae CBS 480.64]
MGLVLDHGMGMFNSNSPFQHLSPRPPTPPRETAINGHDGDSTNAPVQDFENDQPGSKSPSSASPTKEVAVKRVDFFSAPMIHHAAHATPLTSPAAQLRKRSSIKKPAKPLKSILKMPSVPMPLMMSSQGSEGFDRMIQSIIQQLASQSTSARLDAYIALNGAVKLYDDLPDAEILVSNMGILTEFMTRDITWKEADGSLNSNLITQALKFAASSICNPKLSATIGNDFAVFLVERSIAVLEDATMPKSLVKMHLFVLAQQSFPPFIMNANRVDRLITAVKPIDANYSGSGVVVARLTVFQKLLEQAQGTMMARMRDWVGILFHAMLGKIREIRLRAIEFGTLASLRLGTDAAASKAVLDFFQSETENGQTFGEHLNQRLLRMVKDKNTGVSVPQIWSIVVVFQRSKRFPLEDWPQLKNWLLIIQQCLNTSDSDIAGESYIAWNKLVFTIMPGPSTPRVLFNMLKVPSTTGMDRRGSDKHSVQVREFARYSYCDLLHYSLRPGLGFSELDKVWDVYLSPTLIDLFENASGGFSFACAVLGGICTPGPRVWNQNLANESTKPKPDELPCLDAKWVRSRFSKFLAVLTPAFHASMRKTPDDFSTFLSTWRTVLSCVAEAGHQEVKTSNDLKQALISLSKFLSKLFTSGAYSEAPGHEGGQITFVQRLITMLQTSVDILGVTTFGEDIMVRPKEGSAEVSLTPSRRASKQVHAPESPLLFLLNTLHQVPWAWKNTERMADCLLRLLISTRSVDRSTSLHVAPTGAGNLDDAAALYWWRRMAESAISILENIKYHDQALASHLYDSKLRMCLDILRRGLTFTLENEDDLLLFGNLLNSTIATADNFAGNAGASIAVTEPISNMLHDQIGRKQVAVLTQLTIQILSSARWPGTLEDVKEAHLTFNSMDAEVSYSESFKCLGQLTSALLMLLYRQRGGPLGVDSNVRVDVLVEKLLGWIKSSPQPWTPMALAQLQDGIALWVQDQDRTINNNPTLNSTLPAWSQLFEMIDGLPQDGLELLTNLENIFVAGFSSTHESLVQAVIKLWNNRVGEKDMPNCPESIRKALLPHAHAIEALQQPSQPPTEQTNVRFTSELTAPVPGKEQSLVRRSPRKHHKCPTEVTSYSDVPLEMEETESRRETRMVVQSSPRFRPNHPSKSKVMQRLTHHYTEPLPKEDMQAKEVPQADSRPLSDIPSSSSPIYNARQGDAEPVIASSPPRATENGEKQPEVHELTSRPSDTHHPASPVRCTQLARVDEEKSDTSSPGPRLKRRKTESTFRRILSFLGNSQQDDEVEDIQVPAEPCPDQPMQDITSVPESGETNVPSSRTLKRKASAMDDVNAVEPIPEATEVSIVPPAHTVGQEDEVEETLADDSIIDLAEPMQGASLVLQSNEVARPVATPRSIISRLTDVLHDLRDMVSMKPSHERELDDVLFELRKEVHATARGK